MSGKNFNDLQENLDCSEILKDAGQILDEIISDVESRSKINRDTTLAQYDRDVNLKNLLTDGPIPDCDIVEERKPEYETIWSELVVSLDSSAGKEIDFREESDESPGLRVMVKDDHLPDCDNCEERSTEYEKIRTGIVSLDLSGNEKIEEKASQEQSAVSPGLSDMAKDVSLPSIPAMENSEESSPEDQQGLSEYSELTETQSQDENDAQDALFNVLPEWDEVLERALVDNDTSSEEWENEVEISWQHVMRFFDDSYEDQPRGSGDHQEQI